MKGGCTWIEVVLATPPVRWAARFRRTRPERIVGRIESAPSQGAAMTSTIDPIDTTSAIDLHSRAAHPAGATRRGSGRPVWVLWGALAGVSGLVATLLSDPAGSLAEEDYLTGAAIVDELESAPYHVGVVAGFVCVVALLFTAAGWRRWASHRAPDSLAARVVSMAFVASAGAMMIGYGLKGSMAVYLPGGMDHDYMSQEGLYAIFMFLDLGAWMVWWGGTVAALAAVWLAFRERLLPKWIGVVSALFALLPLTVLVLTGLPGLPALSTIWLTIVSIGLALSRRFDRSGEPSPV
jgi:hypothetical protein